MILRYAVSFCVASETKGKNSTGKLFLNQYGSLKCSFKVSFTAIRKLTSSKDRIEGFWKFNVYFVKPIGFVKVIICFGKIYVETGAG